MIEYFGLGDSLIPKLRDLAQTIRSSRWEATLRSPKWGLTHEQAADLSSALLADTQTSPMVTMHKSQVSSLFRSWTRLRLKIYFQAPFLLLENTLLFHYCFLHGLCCLPFLLVLTVLLCEHDNQINMFYVNFSPPALLNSQPRFGDLQQDIWL